MKKVKQLPKTMEGLRDRLFGAMDDLRARRISVSEARAIAQLGTQIVDTARVDILYQAKTKGPDKLAKELGYEG